MAGEAGPQQDEDNTTSPIQKQKRIISVGSDFLDTLGYKPKISKNAIYVTLKRTENGIEATASCDEGGFIVNGMKWGTSCGICNGKQSYKKFIEILSAENDAVVQYRFNDELNWLAERFHKVHNLSKIVINAS